MMATKLSTMLSARVASVVVANPTTRLFSGLVCKPLAYDLKPASTFTRHVFNQTALGTTVMSSVRSRPCHSTPARNFALWGRSNKTPASGPPPSGPRRGQRQNCHAGAAICEDLRKPKKVKIVSLKKSNITPSQKKGSTKTIKKAPSIVMEFIHSRFTLPVTSGLALGWFWWASMDDDLVSASQSPET